jgi:hypothetical protein
VRARRPFCIARARRLWVGLRHPPPSPARVKHALPVGLAARQPFPAGLTPKPQAGTPQPPAPSPKQMPRAPSRTTPTATPPCPSSARRPKPKPSSTPWPAPSRASWRGCLASAAAWSRRR